MANSERDLVAINIVRGINNREAESKLGLKNTRASVNLDLSPDGVSSTRAGYAASIPVAGAHSLWSDPALDFALYVVDDTLYAFDEDFGPVPLRTGLQARDMHYVLAAGYVHFSNGVDTGRVALNRTVSPWGVQTPTPTFVATGTATGGLPPGEYSVTLTYMRAGREESGAPEASVCAVPGGGGVSLTGIPQPADPTITAIRVYMTAVDDPRYFHVRDLAVGMTSVQLGMNPRGRLLDSYLLRPAPAGSYLMLRSGRIFSAQGKLLRWTEPVRYGLYDPATNYVNMPGPITGIGAVGLEGLMLYVGTDKKVYTFQGADIDASSLVAASHVGMVPGSLTTVDAEHLQLEGINYRCPMWLGTSGAFFVGTHVGIMPVNKGAVATVYGKSAVLLREQRGGVQYIVAGRGGRKPGLGITDRAVARVVEIGAE